MESSLVLVHVGLNSELREEADNLVQFGVLLPLSFEFKHCYHYFA